MQNICCDISSKFLTLFLRGKNIHKTKLIVAEYHLFNTINITVREESFFRMVFNAIISFHLFYMFVQGNSAFKDKCKHKKTISILRIINYYYMYYKCNV